MEKGKFIHEMWDAARDGLRRGVDEEVDNERWDNIDRAAMAMLEAGVNPETMKAMLIKYWDLRPSEADRIYQNAEKMLSHM